MLLTALPPKICAQEPIDSTLSAPQAPAYQPVPEISLIVCDPGSEIYELEGHAALRLDFTGSGGDDIIVNWGLFDFDAPNFVYRFVKGETDYRVGIQDTRSFLRQYIRHGRAVRDYPLDLNEEESLRVMQLVAENLKPQNQVYRYNYVRDNCSTRPLQIIDQTRGAQLDLEPHPLLPDSTTFRQAMRHYHVNYPWYQFGIDLALGSGIDIPEQARAMTFAPAALADMLEQSGYKPRYLVPSGNGGPQPPTPWPLRPLTVCWVVAIACAALTVRDLMKHSLSRWFDALLFGLYGIAGCVVFFLIFISVHEATSPNWIGLWLNPLALLVPVCIWLKKTKKLLISYQIANFGAIFALLVLWACGAQSLNAAFLPLILCDMMRSAAYLVLNKW